MARRTIATRAAAAGGIVRCRAMPARAVTCKCSILVDQFSHSISFLFSFSFSFSFSFCILILHSRCARSLFERARGGLVSFSFSHSLNVSALYACSWLSPLPMQLLCMQLIRVPAIRLSRAQSAALLALRLERLLSSLLLLTSTLRYTHIRIRAECTEERGSFALRVAFRFRVLWSARRIRSSPHSSPTPSHSRLAAASAVRPREFCCRLFLVTLVPIELGRSCTCARCGPLELHRLSCACN